MNKDIIILGKIKLCNSLCLTNGNRYGIIANVVLKGRNYMKKNLNEIEVMKKHGFNYDEERNCFVKEGYGALLTNITFRDAAELRAYILNSPMYLSLLNDGYELVSGPAAPCANGIVYDTSAIYCKNYVDVDWKNSRDELTSEEIDGIVSNVDMWARAFCTFVDEDIKRDQKITDLDVAGKSFRHIVNNLMKDYSYGDLYTIVKALDKFYEDDSVEGRLYAKGNVIQPLKEYIYRHVVSTERLSSEKSQERALKVSQVVEEVNDISERYKDVPMCSSREKMNDYSRGMLIRMQERNVVVAEAIERFRSSLSAREIRDVVIGLKTLYREKPLMTIIRVANEMNENIVDRTIDEYYGKTVSVGAKQLSKKQ